MTGIVNFGGHVDVTTRPLGIGRFLTTPFERFLCRRVAHIVNGFGNRQAFKGEDTNSRIISDSLKRTTTTRTVLGREGHSRTTRSGLRHVFQKYRVEFGQRNRSSDVFSPVERRESPGRNISSPILARANLQPRRRSIWASHPSIFLPRQRGWKTEAGLAAGRGRPEPVGKTRRAEARLWAGREALVVHGRAEVAGARVCGHLARVAIGDQKLSDEVVHAD
jgi:hypothetical protein